MLVENNFPADTRVRNEAFSLAANGYGVTVIALRGKKEVPREVVRGVTVYRVPRLTLFEKLPDAENSIVKRLLNKVFRVAGYVTELKHAFALWEHGRSVLRLAGIGRRVPPLLAHRVLFRPSAPAPAGSYCVWQPG